MDLFVNPASYTGIYAILFLFSLLFGSNIIIIVCWIQFTQMDKYNKRISILPIVCIYQYNRNPKNCRFYQSIVLVCRYKVSSQNWIYLQGLPVYNKAIKIKASKQMAKCHISSTINGCKTMQRVYG